jgi:hypothetical protein
MRLRDRRTRPCPSCQPNSEEEENAGCRCQCREARGAGSGESPIEPIYRAATGQKMDRAQDATLTNRGTRQSERATRVMACTTRRPRYIWGGRRRAASQRGYLSCVCVCVCHYFPLQGDSPGQPRSAGEQRCRTAWHGSALHSPACTPSPIIRPPRPACIWPVQRGARITPLPRYNFVATPYALRTPRARFDFPNPFPHTHSPRLATRRGAPGICLFQFLL